MVFLVLGDFNENQKLVSMYKTFKTSFFCLDYIKQYNMDWIIPIT